MLIKERKQTQNLVVLIVPAAAGEGADGFGATPLHETKADFSCHSARKEIGMIDRHCTKSSRKDESNCTKLSRKTSFFLHEIKSSFSHAVHNSGTFCAKSCTIIRRIFCDVLVPGQARLWVIARKKSEF